MTDNDSFVTVAEEITTEFSEKKSVFISSVFVVKSVDEAESKIQSVRKKYPDATHVCYAYVMNNGAVQRFSDDGEPSGTAGMPILNVVNKLGITNVLVTVTRYFGGIKLGAGGLVRAYSQGAADALKLAGKTLYVKGSRGSIEIDYDDFSQVEHMLLARGTVIEQKSFNSGVRLTVLTKEDWQTVADDVTELTGGGAICELEENVFVKD